MGIRHQGNHVALCSLIWEKCWEIAYRLMKKHLPVGIIASVSPAFTPAVCEPSECRDFFCLTACGPPGTSQMLNCPASAGWMNE